MDWMVTLVIAAAGLLWLAAVIYTVRAERRDRCGRNSDAGRRLRDLRGRTALPEDRVAADARAAKSRTVERGRQTG